jgi:pimeloyl-ACP methyl ester carboxylesterase
VKIIQNARQLGEAIGDSLVRLFDLGFLAQNMHLVGFSLGAQIMSITARRVQTTSSRRFNVGRLTGLDPGQIPGLWLPFTGRLSSGDAVYVDSVHTEGKF